MGNQLAVISDITQRALPVLANKVILGDKINRQYDREFGVKGRKIGGTANIRLPVRFVGTFGPALNVEPATENYMPVSVQYQFHIDIQFTTANLLLDVDDFDRRFTNPAMAAIGNRFDSDCCFIGMQNVGNRGGTPGTRPTQFLAFSDAYAALVSEGMPEDEAEPCAVLHPFAHSSMADALKGLFNPQASIAEAYETGMVARKTAGADWFRDANIASYQTGTLTGTPVLAGVTPASAGSGLLTSGWAQNGFLNIQGLTNTAAQCAVGDTIQINGILPANPQSRVAYSNTPKQFVVLPPGGYATMTGVAAPGSPQFASATLTAGTFNATTGVYTSSGSGTLSVLVAEVAIIGGQFQNAVATSAFTGTPAVTINGGAASGINSRENLIFHRDFLAAVTVDLPIPRTAVEAERATDEDLGLSIRMLTQYTVNNDSEPTRWDIAYGIAPLYRQLGYRISG